MGWLGAIAAAALMVIVFYDTFEVMILPRRVRHAYVSRLFLRSAWRVWRRVAMRLPAGRRRQGFLSVLGPLSLFCLLGIWAVGLITGFALLHWSLNTALVFPRATDEGFTAYL